MTINGRILNFKESQKANVPEPKNKITTKIFTEHGNRKKNPDIILKFYDDSRWQYKKGTPNTAGSVFLSGNNFTMHNGIFSLYKKDGEALIGKYKFNGQNNVTISDFSDNKFNGTWIKK